ncbi:AMP-binding protein [Streptomyces sp. NPDC058964]|uniref:AMP-binding protein n=1 Tax=Streptomyces sp. NPDC058964 TaxID=3346681 RepID=UPI0036CBC34A
MPGSPSLADELRVTALTHPDRAAVTDGIATLTYRALDALVADLAAALTAAGVRVGDCVIWHGRKNVAAVAAIHGILRAEAGFVPVDPDGPIARAELIVGLTRPRLLLADGVTKDRWDEAMPALEWRPATPGDVVAGDLWLAPWPGTPREPVESLAYVLHTSGSTGRPKGVVHTQSSALAFIDWAVTELALTCDDVVVNSAPLHFDPSTLHLFGAARVGATVALLPSAAAAFPRKYLAYCRDVGATVLYAVTSTMAWLARRGKDMLGELTSVRAVVFGGEVMQAGDMNILLDGLPQARFLNVYGPTESNVCTFYELPAARLAPDAVIPIGRSLPGTDIVLVGDDLLPVPPGEPGELLVRGPTMMASYLDPADTAKAFVRVAGEPWYATGDLVLQGSSGELEFIGRRDGQIKTRGFRVELGEVERYLAAIEGVHEAVALGARDQEMNTVIIAFVSADRPTGGAALNEALSARVPRYMLPERIIEVVGDLPKLTNGKVDRQSLAQRAQRILHGQDRTQVVGDGGRA